MKKRIVSILLVAAMVAGLAAGCGSKKEEKKEDGVTTVLGLVTMVLFKPRSWCVYCPMGTMTQLICKAKIGEKKNNE